MGSNRIVSIVFLNPCKEAVYRMLGPAIQSHFLPHASLPSFDIRGRRYPYTFYTGGIVKHCRGCGWGVPYSRGAFLLRNECIVISRNELRYLIGSFEFFPNRRYELIFLKRFFINSKLLVLFTVWLNKTRLITVR